MYCDNTIFQATYQVYPTICNTNGKLEKKMNFKEMLFFFIKSFHYYSGWVSEWLFNAIWAIFSYIMVRTRYFLVKWWWYLFYWKHTNHYITYVFFSIKKYHTNKPNDVGLNQITLIFYFTIFIFQDSEEPRGLLEELGFITGSWTRGCYSINISSIWIKKNYQMNIYTYMYVIQALLLKANTHIKLLFIHLQMAFEDYIYPGTWLNQCRV